MAYYIELSILPQEDAPLHFLWSKLYQQLHLAFVEVKDVAHKVHIGVSFPEYRFNSQKKKGFLGAKLRLFAQTEAELQQLNINTWLERLIDYVHITSIRLVPEDKITGYAIFKRKQVKTNAARLARHRTKRGDISFDEALARYSNVVTTTDMPFIQMKSLNSGQLFKLFIEKQPAEKSASQVFSTYGLSSESSVPEF